jgi:ribosomal protein L37AE/L43A
MKTLSSRDIKSIQDVISFLRLRIIECDPKDDCAQCDDARECVRFLEQFHPASGMESVEWIESKTPDIIGCEHDFIRKLSSGVYWCDRCKTALKHQQYQREGKKEGKAKLDLHNDIFGPGDDNYGRDKPFWKQSQPEAKGMLSISRYRQTLLSLQHRLVLAENPCETTYNLGIALKMIREELFLYPESTAEPEAKKESKRYGRNN